MALFLLKIMILALTDHFKGLYKINLTYCIYYIASNHLIFVILFLKFRRNDSKNNVTQLFSRLNSGCIF